MNSNDRQLKIGIVGAAGGRGESYRDAFESSNARIHALCDIEAHALEQQGAKLGVSEIYTDYGQMLENSALDAVVIATPMPLHAPQAIMALERNISVLSEVPAAVSVEECRALVQAASRSQALYMMAENYLFMRPNLLVTELVREGLFGEVYYAEGEYLHELKELNDVTTWRRQWQTGLPGVTYGTHSLGPILQ